MAPELLGGAPPTAASDWYSVGVMLDEGFADGLPADLDALRRGPSFRRDPAERPDGAEIARRVGQPDPHPVARAAHAGEPEAKPPFDAAARHRGQALRSGFAQVARGASLTAYVARLAGDGRRSTLVRRFLDEDVGNALVLRGRAYERESVPYKVLDSVVDALSRHLLRLDAAALLRRYPPMPRRSCRLFPRAPQSPGASETLRGALARGAADHAPPRLRGTPRKLLRSLAERQPVVIFVDDVHWGDSDSATLLVELMAAPPDAPPILFIAAYRAEEAERSPS